MEVKGTVKELDYSIQQCKASIEQTKREIKALEEAKTVICKRNNVCEYCYGDGYTYSKSSDDRVTCPVCNGTGKFTRKEAKKCKEE